MQAATGVEAVLLRTGKVYSSIAKQRADQNPDAVVNDRSSDGEVAHVA